MCRGTIIRMPAHHNEGGNLAAHIHHREASDHQHQQREEEEAKEGDLELGEPQPIDFSQPQIDDEDG